MKPILEIRNLWKSFEIGTKQERYQSLRETLVYFAKNGWQKKENFWALQDISFDVFQGDTLGIIGRNGAGKTTLLKILSRITPPTRGSITVRGRLASLLEVGTGFHPELTGRENIFFNGSILGLRRREILRQLDAIVDFSAVEQFLDTPLKHYSSGMQLRLAFAVAAHLEPEILLIDEVLAVGDAEFQKKCLGKMDEVSKSGRTILFVSHNLSAIRNLCSKAMLIDKGNLIASGNTYEITEQYSKQNNYQELIFEKKDISKPHFKILRFLKDSICYNEALQLEIEIITPFKTELALEVEVRDALDTPLSYSSTAPMQGQLFKVRPNTRNRFLIEISEIRMAAGEYCIYFWLIHPWKEAFDNTLKYPLRFSVVFSDPYHCGFDFKQTYNRGNFHHYLSIIPI